MTNLLTDIIKDKWNGVGVHPTPEGLVSEFCEFTLNNLKTEIENNNEFQLLDIFCGDGRLGKAIESGLEEKNYKTQVTFIEVMKNSISKIPRKSNYSILNENVFNFRTEKRFDLVVSNPPYLVLNSNSSKELGINWKIAKENSKNLYALSILKGLELCKDGGVLCVIAPFGYLRGYFSEQFKDTLEKNCDRIIIKANKARNIFEGVNQDIGFQYFVKRSCFSKNSKTDWQFGYNGHELKEIINIYQFKAIKLKSAKTVKKIANVRVGPIVWNRSKKHLRTKRAIDTSIIIYGSNIKQDNSFSFEIDKLKQKQYIKNEAILETDIIKKPAIFFRRTLRGNPSNWIVDSAILKIDDKRSFTAENHTIVVELEGFKNKQIDLLHQTIAELIGEYYYISGSPTISTKIVNEIVQTILDSWD